MYDNALCMRAKTLFVAENWRHCTADALCQALAIDDYTVDRLLEDLIADGALGQWRSAEGHPVLLGLSVNDDGAAQIGDSQPDPAADASDRDHSEDGNEDDGVDAPRQVADNHLDGDPDCGDATGNCGLDGSAEDEAGRAWGGDRAPAAGSTAPSIPEDMGAGNSGSRSAVLPWERQTAEVREVPVNELYLDPRSQARSRTNPEWVKVLTEQMKSGQRLGQITVFNIAPEGEAERLVVADGWHRIKAAVAAGVATLEARVFVGDLKDAKCFSAWANSQHGLALTLEERKAGAREMMEDEEARRWSNEEIARVWGLSSRTIGRYRKSRHSDSVRDATRRYRRKGQKHSMNVSGIGRKPRGLIQPQPSESKGGLDQKNKVADNGTAELATIPQPVRAYLTAPQHSPQPDSLAVLHQIELLPDEIPSTLAASPEHARQLAAKLRRLASELDSLAQAEDDVPNT